MRDNKNIDKLKFEQLQAAKLNYDNINFLLSSPNFTSNKVHKKLEECARTMEIIYNSLYNDFYTNKDLQKYLETDACCKNCNNKLLISDNISYAYQCEDCDENFYSFEINENSHWFDKSKDEILNYNLPSNTKYFIKYWENEKDRDMGYCLTYDETFNTFENALLVARKIYDYNNFASIEILDSNENAYYCRDNDSEEFYLNNEKICKVSNEIINEYIDNWMDHKELPVLERKIYSETYGGCYIAVDNSTNECYVEEFNTEKEAQDWLFYVDKEVELEINENDLEM